MLLNAGAVVRNTQYAILKPCQTVLRNTQQPASIRNWSIRCVWRMLHLSYRVESIYSSSTNNTEYLRSSAKLARPRRWLEDLTCHQRTLQRRVERRVEPRGAQRRAPSWAIPLGTARDRLPRSRERTSYRVDAGPNAARQRE